MHCLFPAALLLAGAAAAAQSADIAQFRQRQVVRFDSAGHPKANGLAIGLSYPRSWRAGESALPHIVQNFRGPDGAQTCNLQVRDMGLLPTAVERRTALSPANTLSLLPTGAERPAVRAASIGGLPGVEAIYEVNFVQGDRAQRIKTVQLFTILQRSIVELTCAVGGQDRAQAAARFDAALPLFRLIAASIVIRDGPRRSR